MRLDNEFVTVHNEPNEILLCAGIHGKQQQYKTEMLQISKQSSTASVTICYLHALQERAVAIAGLEVT
jgi:hypothetical protein